MKQLLHLSFIGILFFVLSSFRLSPPEKQPIQLSPACQLTDSLALVDIFNSTNGWGWTNTWSLSQPVSTWFGVDLDADGFVIEIHLNNNKLDGVLPTSIGNFKRIEYLQLDNNNLQGDIPGQIGNLGDMLVMFLDNNDFTGTIPTTFSNLSKLQTLYLDNNRLTGPIPQGFTGLTTLQAFDFFNNQIDSLPDLSNINIQWRSLGAYQNNLTFDDILPNMGNALSDRYHPQGMVFAGGSVTLPTGIYYEIDLGIDKGIPNSQYQWFRNGVPHGAPINTNKLVFPAINWSDAGTYTCEITNPDAPLLTLRSRPFTINVRCGTTTYEIHDTLCVGGSRTINGVVYNEWNPLGEQVLRGANQYGCDSLVQIYLQFRANPRGSFEPLLCQGEGVLINGTWYDINNQSGTETLIGSSVHGCDSLVDIALGFHPFASSSVNQTLCADEELIINGSVYSQSRPNGTEVLPGRSVNGCDSTVYISLNFHPPAIGNYDAQLCPGASITINGNVYNQSRPSGTEVIPGASVHGCDSTVYVNLQFDGTPTGQFQPILCAGESIIINGTTYNSTNPSGSELLPNGSVNGCDSLVEVSLNFHPPATGNYDAQLCPGASITINGTVYNQSRPSGTEVIPGASVHGCDSTVYVNLQFDGTPTGQFQPTLCAGESVVVNGTTYNSANPSGSELLPNGSVNGCDSLVEVSLTFHPDARGRLDQTFCSGQQIIINGTTYDQNRPSGVETLAGASQYGCDSILDINLTFEDQIVTLLDPIICPEASIMINGQLYNQSRPDGDELFPGGSAAGCDSLVQIRLQFYEPARGNFSQTLCRGGSLVINGTRYDESNPSGIEILIGASQQGCDSILNIQLNFEDQAIRDLEAELCQNDFIEVGPDRYDAANPSGTTLFPGGSVLGCDSLVRVALTFYPAAQSRIDQTLCRGGSIVVNGTRYDESNPSGSEILAGASVRGCDSTVVIDLSFEDQAVNRINLDMCPGDFVMVGNDRYDETNPSGSTLFPGGSVLGCDSLVEVDLRFTQMVSGTLTQTLCKGASIIVNGTRYDEINPSGTEILNGVGTNGCDSTVIIQLNFEDQARNELEVDLCPGEFVEVGSDRYDESRPSGSTLLPGASVSGCDSLVTVTLNFLPTQSGSIRQSLCSGESLLVNGTRYDVDNPSGTQTLTATNGCDSLLSIELSFFPGANSTYEAELCKGSSITINGTVYDEDQPSGTETLVGASQFGCDSIVTIDLTFTDRSYRLIDDILCPGEQIIVNGQTYDMDQPSGSEMMVGQSGCDSIIDIDLQFHSIALSRIGDELCAGDEILINGTLFNQDYLSETQTLTGLASSGCDSIVEVSLQLLAASESEIKQELCTGASLMVAGNVYDQQNPSGTEILPGMAGNGCDSVIVVDLTFVNGIETTVNSTLCFGEELLVGGETFDENNPSGVVQLTSVSGCDSTITVDLSFQEFASGVYNEQLCSGESVVINGTIYDESQPSGTELFAGASVSGCDSLLEIQLTFFEPAEGLLEQTLCEGERLSINGTVYDQDRPSGVEVLVGAAVSGCDSILTISLEFSESNAVLISESLCSGDFIEVNGTIYDENNPSGTETLPSANSNCDSIIQIDLTFTESIELLLKEEICEGDRYELNGEFYDQPGVYVVNLTAQQSGACDTTLTLELAVIDIEQLPRAFAGGNQIICEDWTLLEAIGFPDLTGRWYSPDPDVQFLDERDPKTEVQGLLQSSTLLIWELAHPVCGTIDLDTILIERLQLPILMDDSYAFTQGSADEAFEFDPRENDDLYANARWLIEWITLPDSGLLEQLPNGNFSLLPATGFTGVSEWTYQICLEDCPDICDTASIRMDVSGFTPAPPREIVNIPNGITPNGDGVNDAFVIDELYNNPTKYPRSHLTVFNRWGDIVFQTLPYENDWEGTNNDGQPLPEGTYYYNLHLETGDGKVYQGDITIVR